MNPELLQQLTKNVDAHLAIVIIEHYEKHSVVNKEDLLQLKNQALLKTKIFDQISTIGDSRLKEQIQNVKQSTETNLADYVTNSCEFMDFVEKNYEDLSKDKFVKSAYARYPEFEKISKDQFIYASKYAKLMYDMGQFAESLRILNPLQAILDEGLDLLSIQWGKTFCEILLKMPCESREDFKTLRQILESSNLVVTPMQQLAQRTQLIHTSLFLYFNQSSNQKDFEELIELLSSPNYLNALLLQSPHLIRYLCAALLLSQNYRKFGNFKMSDFVKILDSPNFQNNDNINIFIQSVLIDFDFNNANTKIKLILQDLQNDYFLAPFAQIIVNNAQALLFETYLQIYSNVEIKMISQYLEVSEQDAEIWIVNLIKNANITAKIDSSKGLITVHKQASDFYEKINNKTRDLLPRTTLLVNNIKRIIANKNN